MDNGAFKCWDMATNTFNYEKWETVESKWRHMLFWAQSAPQPPLWAIVPDIPGNSPATLERWDEFAPIVKHSGFPLAIATQDGMTVDDVKKLKIQPQVITIGGTDEFKWGTVEMWAKEFKRVNVLRCNSPEKLYYLESLGVESCDGTGWNRGNSVQTRGVERWARSKVNFGRVDHEMWPHVCKAVKDKNQLTFA